MEYYTGMSYQCEQCSSWFAHKRRRRSENLIFLRLALTLFRRTSLLLGFSFAANLIWASLALADSRTPIAALLPPQGSLSTISSSPALRFSETAHFPAWRVQTSSAEAPLSSEEPPPPRQPMRKPYRVSVGFQILSGEYREPGFQLDLDGSYQSLNFTWQHESGLLLGLRRNTMYMQGSGNLNQGGRVQINYSLDVLLFVTGWSFGIWDLLGSPTDIAVKGFYGKGDPGGELLVNGVKIQNYELAPDSKVKGVGISIGSVFSLEEDVEFFMETQLHWLNGGTSATHAQTNTLVELNFNWEFNMQLGISF